MTQREREIRMCINGVWHSFQVRARTMLLELLRDHLHLTGTKNGCNQGHCGACTVLVDGRAERACIYPAERAHGRHVETIEGLAQGDLLHPLQRAFAEYGAVQCGFCTPGLIMAAKALLDRCPDPDEAQIKKALRHNLCRCTGYVKIIAAVQAAACMLRGGTLSQMSPGQSDSVIGGRSVRPDAWDKVTGRTLFTADLRVEGMLYAAALRSAFPHAHLRRVDVSRARQMPGVAAVLTAADVPGEKCHGLVQKDWPVLAWNKVRYVGDAIAIVAAETPEQARAALEAIEVEYDPLPVVSSAEHALQPDAPRIHADGNLLAHIQVNKGDVDAAFAQCDLVIEHTYYTPISEHAFLEPEASLAVPHPENDSLTVYVGSQIPFADRAQIAASLAIAEERVRVVHMPTGGAFGGKEDICTQIHAALLAWATQRPVMMVLSRSESIRVHPKRHATVITMKSGVMRDGRILAHQIRILGDTGAYASLGVPVMTRAATHAVGPYEIPNVRVDCYAVYTNNPPAGAFRGFGVTQVHFAAESQMDIIAEAVGISPIELRRRHALCVGASTITGQRLRESVGLLECLDKVEERLRALRATEEKRSAQSHRAGRYRRAWGIALAYKNVGLGNGLDDTAGATIEAHPDGTLTARVGAAEIGQGMVAVLSQIVAEEFGITPERVAVISGDTGQCLDGGATTASRQTFVTGNAVRYAAQRLKQVLALTAAEYLGVAPQEMIFRGGMLSDKNGEHALSLGEVVQLARHEGRATYANYVYTAPPTVPLGQTGDSHFAFGYAAQAIEVEVDTITGRVQVRRVIAAHDVGRALNLTALEGQIEGGIMMGIGYALTEHFVVEDGYVRSDTLARYRIPDISWTPAIHNIIVEHPVSTGPYGAKGGGELPCIPTAPAIANAVYHAVGVRVFRLPIDAHALREALVSGRRTI
ncbi:MAG: molybdopterin cofactor-binding domain-containing protein [Anaerolineae bacterium]